MTMTMKNILLPYRHKDIKPWTDSTSIELHLFVEGNLEVRVIYMGSRIFPNIFVVSAVDVALVLNKLYTCNN